MEKRKKNVLKALKEKYGTERVFVVPFSSTLIIKDLFTPNDGRSMKKDLFGAILPTGKFIERADAEGEMQFQQVIPYALIKNTDDKFFVSRRIEGEPRLRGKLSLGFGGHINPCDDERKGVENIVTNGLNRELKEELKMKSYKRMKFEKTTLYGTVRDLKSSTPDHIGLVYILEMDTELSNYLTIRETKTLEGLWMSRQELLRNYEQFESWAQLILAHMTLVSKTKTV